MPMASGPARRSTASAMVCRACFACLATQQAGPFEQTHAKQEVALRRQFHIEAVRPHDGGQCREIDMRGEIGFAGIGQHIFVSVPAHGLQCVAETGLEMAVVEE